MEAECGWLCLLENLEGRAGGGGGGGGGGRMHVMFKVNLIVATQKKKKQARWCDVTAWFILLRRETQEEAFVGAEKCVLLRVCVCVWLSECTLLNTWVHGQNW